MSDIKLFRTQRLTDNPNGGGLSTGQEVVDGEVNNLFDDIGDIDRTNGNVSLRKAVVQADTDNVETFINLHAIVADAPLDDLVSVVMFSVPGWDSVRDDAKNVVERYVDPSVVTRMIPYDRQLAGQRTLLLFARVEQALPDIGQIFFLEDTLTGEMEAVRVQDRSATEETFTEPQYGDFRANVITVTISQPLKRDYLGSEPTRYFRPEAGRAQLRRSLASDAARFKGVVRLAADAAAGDTSLLLESVFAPIVPAATSEIPIIDSPPPGVLAIVNATHWPATDETTKRVIYSANLNAGARLNFGTAISPGTVLIRLDPFDTGEAWRDAGDGTFSGLPESMGQLRVDYDTGALYALNPGTSPGGAHLRAHPAAVISKSPFSRELPVTQSNRGAVWTTLLRPIPAPGATVVAFRAVGRWYELRDQGDGILRGDAGTGVGSINFATGSLSVTLGALPDENTSLILSWGTSEEYVPITGLTPAVGSDGATVPEIRFTLPVGGVEPGTFKFRYVATDENPAIIDDGEGKLEVTGYGVAQADGTINYSTGEVVIRSNYLPQFGTQGRASWSGGTTEEETFNAVRSGSTLTLALDNPPAPGTLSLMYQQEIVTDSRTIGYVHRLRDNGLGALVDMQGNPVPGSSVNYVSGSITFNPDFAVDAPQYNYSTVEQTLPGRVAPPGDVYDMYLRSLRMPTGVTIAPISISFVDGTAVIARYRHAATAATPNTFSVPFTQFKLDLTAGSVLPLVPGSVSFFTTSTDWHVDRAGTLYTAIEPQTNAGFVSGSIDLNTGIATITRWNAFSGMTYAPRITGGLVTTGRFDVPVASGRMPGSPVRPGSFSLRALRASDGQEIVANADVNGNLDTLDMHGRIDVTSGVWTVAFGRYVLNSALTDDDKSEPWYDASLVDADGYIWRPRPVLGGTIRVNGVLQVATPLDPNIIGINPVRLPLDGRGQIVRPADTLVVLESLPFTMPAGLTAGQVVALPRGGLDSVSLYDQAGLGIPDTLFAVDRDEGEIQMATPLDLAGYVQPLVAIHRVGEPLLVTDVGINGRVDVAQPLSRNYDKDITNASTALVIGNVAARYENLFEQNTWLTEWTEAVVGGPPTSGAQYNELLYPPLVTNHGAITQRWALIFTNSAGGNIVGEELGIIGTFDLVDPVAPVNPATVGSDIGAAPYFQLSPDGLGGGWSTGNVIRFNTFAAGAPIWIARTVRPGASAVLDDRARLQLRWNKD